MTDKIIQFDARERLLTKVRCYIYQVDKLIIDGDGAIDVLMRAYPLAEDDLRIKIVLLLGTLATPAVVDPLIAIMGDEAESEAIRQAAAIQLSVVGGVLDDNDALVEQLLVMLQAGPSFNRANAAFALGWNGNLQAAPYLIDCLFDTEIDVQQAAVNALSNLQDDRLFTVLADRLQKSSKEQQRSILYSLGQFASRNDEIIQICRSYLLNGDDDLRYDALVVLNSVADPNENVAIYEQCLNDADARIRERALMSLVVVEHHHLSALESTLRSMLQDTSAAVRRAAVRLVHHMSPTAVVQS